MTVTEAIVSSRNEYPGVITVNDATNINAETANTIQGNIYEMIGEKNLDLFSQLGLSDEHILMNLKYKGSMGGQPRIGSEVHIMLPSRNVENERTLFLTLVSVKEPEVMIDFGYTEDYLKYGKTKDSRIFHNKRLARVDDNKFFYTTLRKFIVNSGFKEVTITSTEIAADKGYANFCEFIKRARPDIKVEFLAAADF
jgi:hypothetical protein